MAKPTMTMQLDAPAASGAQGFVRLVTSTDDRTVVAFATASGVAVAGERTAKAGRARTLTVTTENLSTTVTGTLRTADLGKPITGTGIPAGTHIASVGDSTFTITAAATASATITATVDVDGLLTFPQLNPNSGASDDVIDDPNGTVWAIVIKYPDAPTPEPVYFVAPDLDGYYEIAGAYLTSRPGDLPVPGSTFTPLDGDVGGVAGANTINNGVVNEDHVRPLIAAQLTNQIDLLPRLRDALSTMETHRSDVLLPLDSMTQPWRVASAGLISSWIEMFTDQLRQYGPVTSDWRPAGRPFGRTSTTTGAVGSHGFGASGVVLDPGESWSDTFGGEDANPGDAYALYITQQAASGGTVRVELDGVQVLGATSTTNATPGAVLGMHKLLESAQLDGELHEVEVFNSGATGSVLLDGLLVHHGTLSVGMILWNGSLSGSNLQVHLDGGGFEDHVRKLTTAGTLAATVLGSGLATYDNATTNTGAEWLSAAQNTIDMLDSRAPLADRIVICQNQRSGFIVASNRWLGWNATLGPIQRDFAEANRAAFVDLRGAVPTLPNTITAANGVDYYTFEGPVWLVGTSGSTLNVDYTHHNNRGNRLIADAIWPVFAQLISPRQQLATLEDLEDLGGGGAVDSVNGETGVVVLDAADVSAVPLSGTATQTMPGTGTIRHENYGASFLAAISATRWKTGGVANHGTEVSSAGFGLTNTTTGVTDLTISRDSAGKARLGDGSSGGGEMLTTVNPTTDDALTRRGYVLAQIAALVDSSPAALDTLNELAAALGDDPNFATTVTNALAAKQPLDTDLTAIAALTSAADKVPYSTGTGTWSLADFTAYGRSLVATANRAALMSLLGLTIADIGAGTMSPGGGGTIVFSNFGTIPLTGWRLSGDTADRMQISGAGFTIGSGSGAGDVSFNRVSAGIGSFGASQVRTTAVPSNVADLVNKAYADALVPAASTTTSGIVELATSTETAALSSSTLASTPAGLADPVYAVIPRPRSGERYTNWINCTTPGITPAQNLLYYVSINMSAGTLDRLYTYLTSTAASEVVRLGLYTAVNGRPSARIVDAGTASASAGPNSLKEITVSQAVATTGQLFGAFVAQGAGTAVFAGGVATNSTKSGWSVPVASDGFSPIVAFTESGVSGALPATAGTLADVTGSTAFPFFGWRYA